MAKQESKKAGPELFSSPVVHQHTIARLIDKLNHGSKVTDAQLQQVLTRAQWQDYQQRCDHIKAVKEMRQTDQQERPDEWLRKYSDLIRKGNLLSARDCHKAEAVFEHAAELISEQWSMDPRIEEWFDRPVRSLFDINCDDASLYDSHGGLIGLDAGHMPLPLKHRVQAPPSIRSVQRECLEQAYEALENRKLKTVRAALLAEEHSEEEAGIDV